MKKLIIPFFAIALITGFSHTILAQVSPGVPSEVPTAGLRVYLRADQYDTPDKQYAGLRRSAWSDVANGNYAQQNDYNLQPIFSWNSSADGSAIYVPVMMFGYNGYANYMELVHNAYNMGIQNQETDIFVVTRSTDDGVQFVFSLGENFTEVHYNGDAGVRSIPKYGQIISNPKIANDGNFHIFNTVNSSTKGELGVDGSYVSVAGDTRHTQNLNMRLGLRASGDYPLFGDIAEFFIYDRILSTEERMQVTEYLRDKFSTDFVAFSAPTQPATNQNFPVVTKNSIALNQNKGSGTHRIIVAREGGAVNAAPTDGVAYTGNTVFGSGQEIGTGNYVIYSGTDGYTTTMTNLAFNEEYHFSIYEYNLVDGIPEYGEEITTSQSTLNLTGASEIQTTSKTGTTINGSLTKGSGTHRLIVARASGAVNATPTDGVTYTGNSTFGSGSQIGSGNYVIYVGTEDTTFSLSSLSPSTAYHLAVYEYELINGVPTYATNVGTTYADVTYPTIPASNIQFSGTGLDEMTVSFTSGNGNKRLVVARSGSAVSAAPVDGQSYSADAMFGSGSQTGTGDYVVYNGTGSSLTVTGLEINTSYHFAVYEYSELSGGNSYLTTNPVTGSASTLLPPPPVVSNAGSGAVTTTAKQIQGSVNPNGYSTSILVNYGTNKGSLSSSTTPQNIGSGTSDVSVAVSLTGLSPATKYYYEISATNIGGTTESAIDSFYTGSYVYREEVSLSSLQYWLAGDGATYTSGSGQPVSVWSNQAGNSYGINAYQVTSAYRPLLISESGISFLRFDGSSDFLELTSSDSLGITNSNYEVFIVAKSSSTDIGFLMGGTVGNFELHTRPGGGTGTRFIPKAGILLGNTVNSTDGNFHIFNAKATSGKAVLRIDGNTSYVSQDARSAEISSLILGVRRNGSYYFNGDIAEVIIYNSNLSDAESTLISEYLADKYSITLTPFTTPTQQASSVVFSNYVEGGVTTSVTEGNGTNRLFVMRETGTAAVAPTNGVVYTSNSVFGSGSTTGTGNYVISASSANSVSVTGLSSSSEYAVDVYEFNEAGSDPRYITNSPASGTTILDPTTSSSSPAISQISTSSINGSITKGNGTNRLILVKKGSAVDASPSDGQTYTADTAFGSGAELGTGNFAIYSGTGSEFTVTGLEAGSEYYFSVFEYNGTEDPQYLTSSVLTFSEKTIVSTPEGFPGSAITFGNDEDIMVSHSSEFNTRAITIELWFKSDDSGTDYDFLTSKATGELEVHLGAGGVANTIRFIPTTQVYLDSPVGVFTAGEWTHLAVVYDPSNSIAKMYVNGEEVTLTSNGPNPITTAFQHTSNPFYLGSRGGSSLPFNGSMDEVRIWNRVRTVDEIREFMHRPVQSGYQDMIAYWQFNEGSGTALSDKISGLDGTLENFEFNASNGWEDSDIAFGSGSFTSEDGVTTGTHSLAELSSELTDDFDNAVTLTSDFINTAPNVLPEITLPLEDAYWLIDAIGTPGDFEASLTFTVPSSIIATGVASNSQFKLFWRPFNGTGTWTVIKEAASSFGSNMISFSGVSELGQFTIGREINIEYAQGPGSAVKFDGVNDNISIANNDAFDLEKLSLEFWFKLSSDGNDYQTLVSKNLDDFEIIAGKQERGIRFSPTTGVYIDSPGNVFTLNTWTHFTVVYDPSQSLAKFYFNGIEVATTSSGDLSTALGSSTSGFVFGNRSQSSVPFKGELDEIRLWNTIRTPSQIQQDMNKPTSSGYAPGLVAYWQFNEGTGTNTAEATSNLSGILNNFDFNAASGWLSSRAPVEDRVRVQTSLTGTEGWRLLATPVSDSSLSSLLSNIWTQGFTGAKVANGSPNVFTWSVENGSNGSSNWSPLTDISNSPSNGAGALVYVFSDDDGPGVGGDAGFPKTIGTGGLEPTEDRNLNAVLNTNANGWTLIGNPFKKDVDWDQFSKTNLSDVVYTYDNSSSSWKEWSDGAGDLTDGEIGAFNAFFVQTTGENPTLTVPRSARLDSARKFLGKSNLERGIYTLSLSVENEAGFEDKVWFRISDEGDLGIDNKDGYNLVPLSPDYLMLGALLNDGTDLSINNLPVLDDLYEFPLSVSTTNSGEHQVSVGELSLPEGWTIQLTDKETGKTSDLSEPYVFNMNANVEKAKVSALAAPAIGAVSKKKGESRFVISISPKGEEGFETTPDVFALDQNYPNPFNPSTMIRYQLPVSSEVSLKVFDILGREVAELINGRIEAGHHQIQFNARDLASGMYLYRLQAGDQVFIKKLTLIK